MPGYYDYEELKNKALSTGSAEDLKNLAEWFHFYGSDYWNGESWDLENGYSLYPIYEETEPDSWTETGYEIR